MDSDLILWFDDDPKHMTSVIMDLEIRGLGVELHEQIEMPERDPSAYRLLILDNVFHSGGTVYSAADLVRYLRDISPDWERAISLGELPFAIVSAYLRGVDRDSLPIVGFRGGIDKWNFHARRVVEMLSRLDERVSKEASAVEHEYEVSSALRARRIHDAIGMIEVAAMYLDEALRGDFTRDRCEVTIVFALEQLKGAARKLQEGDGGSSLHLDC